MEPKISAMNQEPWHQAETAATRTVIAAAVTGLCSWVVNYLRGWNARRREQRQVAASVAAMREVVDPASPTKPDLGVRVDAIQRELQAQQEVTKSLGLRLDENIQDQQSRHTELCRLILDSRR